MSVDKAPSFINRTPEPIAKGVDEQVGTIVSLVIDKKQPPLQKQYLSQKIRNFGSQSKSKMCQIDSLKGKK